MRLAWVWTLDYFPIHTGWVNAPFAAASQTSKRTQRWPVRFRVLVSVRLPNARVSTREIHSR